MIRLLLATTLAAGVFLVFEAATGAGRTGSGTPRRSLRSSVRASLDHAGLTAVRLSEVLAVVVAVSALSGLAGFAVFGAIVPAAVIALGVAVAFSASYRRRAAQRRAVAHDSWPRLIEEMRILIGSSGRSIPNALFEAGRSGPEEIQDAFAAAHREWLLTTDFDRTVETLKTRLADSTADMVCETLLIAHDVGGADADARLAALAEDRRADLHGRRDAIAQQAGARFARRFVLLVPLGMAIAGMSVGNGRAAYQTTPGQAMVVVALALMAVCWVWAGRIMTLPEERRIFR